MTTSRAIPAALAAVAVLIVATTLTACGGDRNTDTPQAGAGGGEDQEAECDPGMDEAFGAWADAGFSGSVAISTGGQVDCLAAYGESDQAAGTPNTVDTVFSIGSVSKSFTAAAVYELVDAGELSLDDRAGDLVPGLTGPAAQATVEQLLLHTSGLTGSHGSDHQPLDRDAAVAAISGLEQAFAPGEDFLYSNAGYTLLALIVEETAGTPYRDHMAAQVLPLPDGDRAGGFWDGEPAAPGPRAVGYLGDGPTKEMGDFSGPHWAMSGNGDLAMTMSDLAAWTHALFTGQVVSPPSAEAIARPGFDNGDGTAEASGWAVLDAAAYGEPLLASAGGGGDVGHDVVVAWLPESQRVIAFGSNTPEITAEDLMQAVGPALVAGEPLPRPEASPRPEVDPAEQEAVAGTYALASGGSFEVSSHDDGLAVAAIGADAMAALFPLPADVTAEDVRTHEDQVSALLAGETPEGQEERQVLEDDLGPIDGVALAGTVVADGELRTYVTVTSGTESLTLWYALDERGGIGAVEAAAEPPTLVVVPAEAGGYRPADPTGTGPDVTVTFDGDRMTVTGPDGPNGPVVAGRSPGR